MAGDEAGGHQPLHWEAPQPLAHHHLHWQRARRKETCRKIFVQLPEDCLSNHWITSVRAQARLRLLSTAFQLGRLTSQVKMVPDANMHIYACVFSIGQQCHKPNLNWSWCPQVYMFQVSQVFQGAYNCICFGVRSIDHLDAQK